MIKAPRPFIEVHLQEVSDLGAEPIPCCSLVIQGINFVLVQGILVVHRRSILMQF